MIGSLTVGLSCHNRLLYHLEHTCQGRKNYIQNEQLPLTTQKRLPFTSTQSPNGSLLLIHFGLFSHTPLQVTERERVRISNEIRSQNTYALRIEIPEEDLSCGAFPFPLARAIGVDMGIADRAAFSDSLRIEAVKANRRKERRLAQRLSRVKRRARGRRYKHADFGREKSKIALRSRQITHMPTTAIARRYDFSAVEDLHIRNMTKSVKATIDNPEQNVARKRGLNREILEQSWGEFQSQLAYEAEWAGKLIERVRPHHTSQICSGCGVRDGSHRKGKRYDCGRCGLIVDADRNAAINILRRAIDDSAGRVGTGSRKRSGAARAVECETTELIGAGAR